MHSVHGGLDHVAEVPLILVQVPRGFQTPSRRDFQRSTHSELLRPARVHFLKLLSLPDQWRKEHQNMNWWETLQT